MESWVYQLPVAVTTIVLAIVGGGIAYGRLSTRIDQITDEQKKIKDQEEKLVKQYNDMRDDVRDIKHQQKLDALEIKNTLSAMSTSLQGSLQKMESNLSSLSDRIEDANDQVAALNHNEHSHAKEMRTRISGIETMIAMMRGVLHGQGMIMPATPPEQSLESMRADPLMNPTPSHLPQSPRQQKPSVQRRQPMGQDG